MTDDIETISAEEYRRGVEDAAGTLAEYAREDVDREGYTDTHSAALDLVTDVLDGHQWFSRRAYGSAAHGCIVEHSEADPNRYGDLVSLTESDEPETILERTAYLAFEADVLRLALERVGDE